MSDQKPNVLFHHGRRYWVVQHQCLQLRRHGVSHAEHRSHCQRRRTLHRLVWPAELHRRTRSIYHWTIADTHGFDKGWICREPISDCAPKIPRSPMS